MMKYSTRQAGFGMIEMLLVIAAIALMGFLGYTFLNNRQEAVSEDADTSQAATSSDVQTAPTISSTDDLDDALQALEETDIEGSSEADASQLDSQYTDF